MALCLVMSIAVTMPMSVAVTMTMKFGGFGCGSADGIGEHFGSIFGSPIYR